MTSVPIGSPTAQSEKQIPVQELIEFSSVKYTHYEIEDKLKDQKDLIRVYNALRKEGETREYALTFVFIVITGIEMHRAWHMTMFTSELLKEIKDKYKIRTTWDLGVTKLKFRVGDGKYELHRTVPYDYDSEFQDLYRKIAKAYIKGYITVDQALIFQAETKDKKHTAESGIFLREFPGRLVLYPLEAATCTVIFFGGDWYDALVAAICGFASGIVEYALAEKMSGIASKLVDVLVGVSTGIIAGLFYRFDGQSTCLPAVFLGTLYWFFYGTAFVLGMLEIITGDLETGVTRFMAVSVKTFVLTLGTTFGMQMTLTNSVEAWQDQQGNCNNIDLDEQWWRIPLYLACSFFALGQYRFPVAAYWRGLVVQLAGYEVQYQLFKQFAKTHDKDFLDTASANACGAIAAVIAANFVKRLGDFIGDYYDNRVLLREKESDKTSFASIMFGLNAWYIRFSNKVGFGKKNDVEYLNNIYIKLKGAKDKVTLKDEGEENVVLEAIVFAEQFNYWALLMPTVYQLVPGSLIARLWFNAVFPPPLIEEPRSVVDEGGVEVDNLTYKTVSPDQLQEAVFQSLMVVSASLAIGLLVGFGVVDGVENIIFPKKIESDVGEKTNAPVRDVEEDGNVSPPPAHGATGSVEEKEASDAS